MKPKTPCAPELYDPTIKTTVDEAQPTISNPGRLIDKTDSEKTEFELDRSLILIGNDPAADIIIDHARTPGYIAEITHERGRYILRSLQDRPTITIGGMRIVKHTLADGDEIHLGDRTFLYRAPSN